MSKTLLVVASICAIGVIAGCATSEKSKATAPKVEPAKPAAAAKTEPAPSPKPSVST